MGFVVFMYILVEQLCELVNMKYHFIDMKQRLLINVSKEFIYTTLSIVLSILFHPNYYYQVNSETVIMHAYHSLFRNGIMLPDWLVVSYHGEKIARNIAVLS